MRKGGNLSALSLEPQNQSSFHNGRRRGKDLKKLTSPLASPFTGGRYILDNDENGENSP